MRRWATAASFILLLTPAIVAEAALKTAIIDVQGMLCSG